jgi:methylene-fatty-acyl-phospholipid synthase
MDAPVTAFPFSIMNNPMYNGSTMTFVGSSLWYVK